VPLPDNRLPLLREREIDELLSKTDRIALNGEREDLMVRVVILSSRRAVDLERLDTRLTGNHARARKGDEIGDPLNRLHRQGGYVAHEIEADRPSSQG